MRSLKEFISRRKTPTHRAALDDKTIFFLFRKIVKEEYGVRGETELVPAAFKDGVLSVKARSPLYSSELWVRREAMISRMNAALEHDGVKEIRLARYAP